jgi:hypothetical protein
MSEYLMESILQLQRILEFSDVFQSLAGEALAAWIDQDQKLGKQIHYHKATA